eukprot:8553374-Ditylum_brightwellii.AAC.1
MPLPPTDTNPAWVASYFADEDKNEQHLNDFIAAENEKRRNCASYALQPLITVLLPDYDPRLLTKIKAKADFDKTHPKAKIGVV